MMIMILFFLLFSFSLFFSSSADSLVLMAFYLNKIPQLQFAFYPGSDKIMSLYSMSIARLPQYPAFSPLSYAYIRD